MGLGGLALAGGGYATGAFREARGQADSRLFGQGAVIATRAGALEYAVAGDGPPVMMIHGTGGGFDQGLLFAAALRQRGFRIVAPSRFGYLGSTFPDDASPAHQADILAVGQQIGEVGNSGESAEPHLHIHAQMPGSPDAPYSGTPVLMRLEGRFLVRNDLVQIGVRPAPTNP